MQEASVSDIILLTISCLVVLTNAAVCWLVVTRKVLRTYTNGFVVSLAVSDILSGGVFMPLTVVSPNSTVRGHIVMMIIVSSTLNLSAVAFDRYLAVVSPLAYKSRIGTSFVRIVCAVWSASVAMSVLPVIWSADETLVVHKVYLSCAVILFLVVPLIFILFVYTFIFVKLRQHGKLLRNLQATRTRLDEARRSRRESKTVKMFFSIVAVFAACWIPVIYMTFAFVANRFDLINEYLPAVSNFSILISSFVNPFLYTFMKQDFRKEAVNIFCTKLRNANYGESASESQLTATRAPFAHGNETEFINRA